MTSAIIGSIDNNLSPAQYPNIIWIDEESSSVGFSGENSVKLEAQKVQKVSPWKWIRKYRQHILCILSGASELVL